MPKPPTYPDTATLRAVQAAGGITATARLCSVTTRAVQKWCGAGVVPGLREALLVADAAGVDVRTLAAEAKASA